MTPLNIAPIDEAVPVLHPEREPGEVGVLLPDAPVDPHDGGRHEGQEEHRVDRHLLDLPGRGDLLDRWRNGSPAVLARPPQPQIQEQ